MEYLDKIEQLFKANEIILAVQLCKSQGYNLREVIQAIFDNNWDKSKSKNYEYNWQLNGIYWEEDNHIGISVDNKKGYVLWKSDFGHYDFSDLDDGLNELCSYLIKYYG